MHRRRNSKLNRQHAAANGMPGTQPSQQKPALTRRQAGEERAAHVRALDSALRAAAAGGDGAGDNLAPLRSLAARGFDSDATRRTAWPLLLGMDVAAMDARAEQRAQAIEQAKRSGAVARHTTASSVSSDDSSSTSPSAAAAPDSAAAAAVPLPLPPAYATPASPHSLPLPYDYSSGVLFRHRSFDQIEKDLVRSLAHSDQTRGWKTRVRSSARGALGRVLHTLFSAHDELHYIQGFHDIASVLLLVCQSPSDPSRPFDRQSNGRGEELAYRLTERLALMHLRDSLRPSLDVIIELLNLLFPLLSLTDPALHAFLQSTGVQSFFTLSWLLTWFAHNLDHQADMSRVFDFFLSSHPLMPLYATVALILQNRAGLLNLRRGAVRVYRERLGLPDLSHSPLDSLPQDADVHVDLSAVHEFFQNLPRPHPDALFATTRALAAAHPPSTLLGMLRPGALPADSPLGVQWDNAKARRRWMRGVDDYLVANEARIARAQREGTWGRLPSQQPKARNNRASTLRMPSASPHGLQPGWRGKLALGWMLLSSRARSSLQRATRSKAFVPSVLLLLSLIVAAGVAVARNRRAAIAAAASTLTVDPALAAASSL